MPTSSLHLFAAAGAAADLAVAMRAEHDEPLLPAVQQFVHVVPSSACAGISVTSWPCSLAGEIRFVELQLPAGDRARHRLTRGRVRRQTPALGSSGS